VSGIVSGRARGFEVVGVMGLEMGVSLGVMVRTGRDFDPVSSRFCGAGGARPGIVGSLIVSGLHGHV